MLSGGGIVYIKNLLNCFARSDYDFKVIVFILPSQLKDFPINPKIYYYRLPSYTTNSFLRLLWHSIYLHRLLAKFFVSVLLVPGGVYLGRFRPYLSVSQNMLPFEFREMARYRLSFMTCRLLLLHILMRYTFEKSKAIIFLSEYAFERINSICNIKNIQASIVPHGISRPSIGMSPRAQLSPMHNRFNSANDIRILYVSTIDVYKHQWNVAEAIYILRSTFGLPISLTLIGSNVDGFPSVSEWFTYKPSISHSRLLDLYRQFDYAIFASTCENLPITLLEMMAFSIPFICSNRRPMIDVVGPQGIFFDPEDSMSIADALLRLHSMSSFQRDTLSKSLSQRVDAMTWQACTSTTINLCLNSIDN